jgi:hypothetical protein
MGFLILDECQRCPPKVFTSLITKFDSRYMLGLANTTQRKDRLSRFIYYYLGDVVYTINEKDAKEGRGIIHAHIVARTTDFDFPYRSRADYSVMLDALMRDPERNRIIADDVEAELREASGPVLILSGGEEQDETIEMELTKRGIEVMSFIAPPEEREEEPEDDEEYFYGNQAAVDPDLPRGPVAVLMTPQAFTRSFRRFNSKVIFLAVPLFFRSRFAHAMRNLHQNGNEAPDRLKIYDYVDHKVGLLENYFRMRSYNYGVHPDVLLNRN